MRNLRGRDQEKVGKRKEELWGRPCTTSFVIALWPLTPGKGPLRTDVGDWLTSVKVLFTWVLLFVMTQDDRRWSTTRLVFSRIYWGAETTVISFSFFSFFFSFCPNTVTAYVEGYTLYCIYAMWSPAQPAGGRLCSHCWVSTVRGDAGGGFTGDLGPVFGWISHKKPSCLLSRVVQNVVLMSPRIVGRTVKRRNDKYSTSRRDGSNILHESGPQRTWTPLSAQFCGLNDTKVRNMKVKLEAL